MINNFLNQFFKLSKYNTNIKTEFLAALATYISGCYILFVNPIILGKTGMDEKSLFMATAFAAIVGTLLISFIANTPFLMAPGMGANSWFTFTIVMSLGLTWQQGLAAIFLGGILFVIFTATKIRHYLIEAFSNNIKYGIGAGIGLFIAFIGLKLGGVSVFNPITVTTLGNPFSISVIMTILGVILITILHHYKVTGSLIISVMILSIAGLFLNESSFTGIISTPPSIAPTFFQMDFSKILEVTFISVALSAFLIDFLDSTGAFVSLLPHMKEDINSTRAKKSLFVDGVASSIGAIFGTSTVTAYIESASGIKQGGRTGLTALFLALFFALSIFFSPLLTLIPAWATAPVLVYIGGLMFTTVLKIDWEDLKESIPTFLTIIIMPLTSSIAHGIGVGIISWVLINIFTKQFTLQKHWILLFIVLGYIIMLYNL